MKNKVKYCEMCGVELPDAKTNRKYCESCNQVVLQQKIARNNEKRRIKRIRQQNKTKPVAGGRGPFDLTGKSLSRVACEAKALGLTYGQYVTACNDGTIKKLIRDLHIKNAKKIVENAWENRKIKSRCAFTVSHPLH